MAGLDRNFNVLTLAYTLQKCLGSRAQNAQSVLPAFFYFFHFRGLKNVKQNEEMKQMAMGIV